MINVLFLQELMFFLTDVTFRKLNLVGTHLRGKTISSTLFTFISIVEGLVLIKLFIQR